MKAALFHEYGGTEVLRIENVPKPVAGEKEILVKVKASAVNPKDTFVRKGRFKFISGENFPQSPGYDYSGIVEDTGPGITHVKKGDEVYGYIDDATMRGRTAVEYVALPVHQVALKPETIGFIEAASVPCAALTALQALRDFGSISEGAQVCINGASGGVGTFAVQIAAACYRSEVTAVCSTSNHEYVTALGAAATVDYHETDILEQTGRFHIFFDVFGNQDYLKVMNILHPGGVYVTTVPGRIDENFKNPDEKKAHFIMVKSSVGDLEQLAAWIDGGMVKPVIAATYPLEKIREAHQQVETKHTRGKVVLEIG